MDKKKIMNKNKELIKNTFILFLGKFCTQFISFLLIPIYTQFLISEDYGYVDLIQTYVMLIVPIIILRLDSGVFRFLIDSREDELEKKNIISSCIIFVFFQIILFTIILIILNVFFEIKYFKYVILNSVSIAISNVLLQISRGIGKNISYSISSIISGLSTLVLNIIFIVVLKYDGRSILAASFIGNIICSIYLLYKIDVFKYLRIKDYNFKKISNVLKYSIPMIPDGLSWWIINVSDRTFITLIIGAAANGIYAISSKFSNVLFSIFQIFNMSWQESASLHIDDKDNVEFFSSILNSSYKLFFSICIFILGIMPYIFDLVIGNSYFNAYYYIPILLLGNLFNAFANVIGGVYIAKKNSTEVAKTTFIAAIINIVINLLFINKFGLYAAAISTLLSYVFLAIYRYIDVQKYLQIIVNKKVLFISMVLFIICSSMYYINNSILNTINLVVIISICLIMNRTMIKGILKKIGGKKYEKNFNLWNI